MDFELVFNTNKNESIKKGEWNRFFFTWIPGNAIERVHILYYNFGYVKNEYVCQRTHFFEFTVTITVMCVSHEQIIVRKVRVQDNICKWVGNGTKGQNKYGFYNQKISIALSYDVNYTFIFSLFTKNIELFKGISIY